MKRVAVESAAGWTADSLAADPGWTFSLSEKAQRDLVRAVRWAQNREKALFDYRRGDFELGAASETLAAAFNEAKHGRGIALVRGLPRDRLDEAQFELLTWAIGLHQGVPRGRRVRPATISRRCAMPARRIAVPAGVAIPRTPSSISTPTARMSWR